MGSGRGARRQPRGWHMRLARVGILALLLLTATGERRVHGQAAPGGEAPPGQWSTAQLSQARWGIVTATVGRRVLFAGGLSGRAPNVAYWDTVDIYDDATGQWSTARLAEPRRVDAVAVVGSRAIFAGGNEGTTGTVDVYDAADDRWHVAQPSPDLSASRPVVVGQRVLFVADGDRVDIFDSTTGQWSAATLSTSRAGPAVAVAGQQAVIVGVSTELARVGPTAPPEARTPVDIYDAATDRWSTAELSDARWRDVAAVALGDRVFIAGGGLGPDAVSDAVDIYDSVTGAWSTARLSEARMDLLPIAVGDQILFAGGYTGFGGPARDVHWTRRVDIYDSASEAWSTAELSVGWRFVGFVVDGRAVFAGGHRGARSTVGPSRQVDVYDSRTGAWAREAALHQTYNEPLLARAIGPFGLVISRQNVDVYDSGSGRWSTTPLPEREFASRFATVGSRLLIAGSGGQVHIYDTAQR
jgi:hypothetical protein